MADHAPHLVGSSEHRVRGGQITSTQCRPDARRGDGLTRGSTVEVDQLVGEDLESHGRPEVLEHPHVAGTLVTEVEVGTDRDETGSERGDEVGDDEVLGRLERPLGIEANDEGGVHAAAGEQFELLVEVGEQERGRVGPDHRCGMAIEGDDDRSKVALGGEATERGDHLAVPAMDTVERADGDCGTASGIVGLIVVEDDVHRGSNATVRRPVRRRHRA